MLPPKGANVLLPQTFYGRKEAWKFLREDSKIGAGFLAEVCQEWENAAMPAKKKGIRVVHRRIGAFLQALNNETLSGAVNAVAPRAVTNAEFTKTLGKVLSRPTIFPLPGFAARLALGEMADDLLLSSARIEPARLLASGYQFKHPELEGARRDLLR